MTTINLVLTCILCAMIGFAIGNVWGKESMKRTFTDVMEELTKNIDIAAGERMTPKGE